MKKLIPDAEVRTRLGSRSQRTIDRWTADPAVNFPRPIYIRGRKFRELAAIEAFEARMIAEAAGETAA